MTKKIQYRDPSSSEWKDITAEDIGAATEDVSKGILISTATPPTDPENNKIYVQDNGINHDIYVKNVYNRVIEGPFQPLSLNDLEDIEEQNNVSRTNFYKEYQDDYALVGTVIGQVIYPVRKPSNIVNPFVPNTYSIVITFYYNINNKPDSFEIEIYDQYQAYTATKQTIFIETLNNNPYKVYDGSGQLILLSDGSSLKIAKNTPILAIANLDWFSNSNPNTWRYNITSSYNPSFYSITYSTDNKYDLLDYKDFSLNDVTNATVSCSNITSNITINSASYRKWGRIGQLNIIFSPTTTIAANVTAGLTIPNEYRPHSFVSGGNKNWAAGLDSYGIIGLRNISGATITPNSAAETIGFTYIILND